MRGRGEEVEWINYRNVFVNTKYALRVASPRAADRPAGGWPPAGRIIMTPYRPSNYYPKIREENLQDCVVAALLGEFEEKLAKEFEDVGRRDAQNLGGGRDQTVGHLVVVDAASHEVALHVAVRLDWRWSPGPGGRSVDSE
jgi:hypothetical protein